MRVSEFVLENVTSYRDETAFSLDPALNIFIGPNGGGKTNAIQCLWVMLEKLLFQHYKVEESPDGPPVKTLPGVDDAFSRHVQPFDKSKHSRIRLTIIPDESGI